MIRNRSKWIRTKLGNIKRTWNQPWVNLPDNSKTSNNLDLDPNEFDDFFIDDLIEMDVPEQVENPNLEDQTIEPLRFPKQQTISSLKNLTTFRGNEMFVEKLGTEILITLEADQLNLLGQTFRPVFCGRVVVVANGHITLDPVIIKMPNAPFHRHPTPLSFPINQISTFVDFDCKQNFPIH